MKGRNDLQMALVFAKLVQDKINEDNLSLDDYETEMLYNCCLDIYEEYIPINKEAFDELTKVEQREKEAELLSYISASKFLLMFDRGD